MDCRNYCRFRELYSNESLTWSIRTLLFDWTKRLLIFITTSRYGYFTSSKSVCILFPSKISVQVVILFVISLYWKKEYIVFRRSCLTHLKPPLQSITLSKCRNNGPFCTRLIDLLQNAVSTSNWTFPKWTTPYPQSWVEPKPCHKSFHIWYYWFYNSKNAQWYTHRKFRFYVGRILSTQVQSVPLSIFRLVF